LLPSLAQAQDPIFTITPAQSSVKFFVKASVALEGNFDKWDATLTFPSTDPESAVPDIKIQADSVNTGSGLKDDKLKSKDFFDKGCADPRPSTCRGRFRFAEYLSLRP
jgi:polyisoprenoid-binding protein YceI